MASTARTRNGSGYLVTTLTAAVPLAGWTVHTVVWHRRLAAARRDPVTGLHTRDGYVQHATQLISRYGDKSLILFLDMAGFKQINDLHGHDTGNEILSATGQRLASWCGTHGVAARLHGDEFAAAVRIPPARRPVRLAQLAHQLHQPVQIGDTLVDVSVSIGASSPSDLGTRELSLLMRGADSAMYDHKHHGGQYRIADLTLTNTPTENGRRAGRPGTRSVARTA
ncbi:GGDEF domain-containing protein [Streptomyces abikoensis]|uniref:GGDEF domain-containing protein n=1 Tax=Streptomyces abikoensis TaxID=97398 RepID=A0ABW7TGN8_9ACTN